MIRLIFSFKLVLVFLMAAFQGANAQSYEPGYFGMYAPIRSASELRTPQAVLTPLDTGLLGDSINPDMGSLSFSNADVSLPGNSNLPVQFSRSLSKGTVGRDHALGDWSVDVPRIETNVYTFPSYAWHADRCTGSMYPRDIDYFIEFVGHGGANATEQFNKAGADYYGGVNVIVPGQSAGRLLEPSSDIDFGLVSPRFVTNSFWKIQCLSGQASDGGDAFVAIAPNGDEYTFDVLRYHQKDMNYSHTSPSGFQVEVLPEQGEADLRAVMYASRVEDVHGNWVSYTYNAHGPTKIESNDGRVIDIVYSTFGLVETVTANGRTWTYQYGYNSRGDYTELDRVTRPDTLYWEYDVAFDKPGSDPMSTVCGRQGWVFTVKHPHGVTGTFEEEIIYNGVKNATEPSGPISDLNLSCTGTNPAAPEYSADFAITKKTLSGAGIGPFVWTYSYEQDFGSYIGANPSLPATKKRTIIDPTGAKKVIHVNRENSWRQGLIEKVETYPTASAITPLQVIESTYETGLQVGVRSPGSYSNAFSDWYNIKKTLATITQGSDIFSTQNTFNHTPNSPAYSYGLPIRVEVWSNLSTPTRIIDISYVHDKTKWILELPDTVMRNGKLFDDYTYDSLGRLTRHDRFGALYKTFGYHGAGTQGGALAWAEDALLRRTSYGNYKRGAPQLVTRADNTTFSRTIDDNGWVTSETNWRGITTSYLFNSVGWLTIINRSAPWADTAFGYHNLGSGMTQTASQGTVRKTTSYDGLLRPRIVKTEATSGGGLTTYIATAYDAFGRTRFASYPSTSAAPTAGVETSYDVLGRVTQTRETVSPNATMAVAYLSGNRTRVTDPRGYVTTTTRHAYGSPDNGDVTKIEQPEGVTTDMTYDDWGNMLTATQYGGGISQIQSYIYDNRLRLCRHSVPETGDVLYEYDAADQMVGVARGQAAGSACATLPTGDKVARSYDLLGQVNLVNYPDITPDISITYDANGNVTRNARAAAVWDYQYDTADQLTEEKLTVDGRLYTTNYLYDSDGDLLSQTTPAGRIVNYTPNGLGQAKRAEAGGFNYASGINYHPNGSVTGMLYGNGHVLTKSLNARQLVSAVKIEKPGTKAADMTYAYDAAGQILSINDLAVAGESRSYGYDGLGRMTSATGPWGNGAYSYDALGNLTLKTLGARTVEAEYDSLNRLSRIRDSAISPWWRDYVYDNRGNVVSNDIVAFSYGAGELPRAMSGGSFGSGAFVYDGNQKRVKQTINGEIIYSVYSQSGAILYRDNITSGEATDYVRAAGMTIARVRNSVTTFPHQDHVGSPIAETGISGAVNWRESYTPYGEKRLDPVMNRDNEAFTGHIHDDVTGLTYMQARYYDPVIGRFLSNDPVGFAQHRPQYFNRYSYTLNDPINRIDSDGRQSNPISLAQRNFENRNQPLDPAVVGGLLTAVEIGFVAADFAIGGPTGEGIIPAAAIRAAREGGETAMQRGVRKEAEVLKDMGLDKNTTKVSTSEGKAIPDAVTDKAIVEIKDTCTVSCTKQVRIETGAAAAAGKESVLVTGTNTHVTKQADEAFDRIIRRDDLGPE